MIEFSIADHVHYVSNYRLLFEIASLGAGESARKSVGRVIGQPNLFMPQSDHGIPRAWPAGPGRSTPKVQSSRAGASRPQRRLDR